MGRSRPARSVATRRRASPFGWLVLTALLLGTVVASLFAASREPAPEPSLPVPGPSPAATGAPTATVAATRVATTAALESPTATRPVPTATVLVRSATVTAAPPIASSTATRAAGGTTLAPRTTGVVALTFDAGADRGHTVDILDLLRDEHVAASFGITGQWAKANGDLVKRMASEGHLVINHTLDHRSFTGVSDNLGGLSAAARRAELEDADAILAPLVGHSTRPWYRLPYGDDDARVAADVGAAGYTRKAGWTVDSLGWRGLPASDIVSRCLTLAAPNAVYVLHVGRASQDGPALPAIVAGLRRAGYGFATLAAL